MKATSPAAVIAGEAVSGTREQRWNDMLHIASVVVNRAKQLGVSVEDVVSTNQEFNAYNKALPPGAEDYVSMAEQALSYVQENGPVTNATFYSTPSATDGLPDGLAPEAQTDGHVFFSDPQARSIHTAKGYVQPNQELTAFAPTTEDKATPFDGILGPSLRLADPAPSGILGGVKGGGVFSPEDAAPTPRASIPGIDISTMALEDRPAPAMPDVSYDMGPGRPYAPDESVVRTAQLAADSVLGPNSSISLTSGLDDAKQTGTTRHGTGLAADFTFTDPNGRMLSWQNPADVQKLQDIAQAAAAIDGSNIGLGYANAPHMMHIDNIPASQLSPDQDQEWGAVGNEMAGILADARENKTMPSSYWDRVATNVEQTGVMPSLLDRNALQAAQPSGIMSALNPASVDPVTQGPDLAAPVHNAVPSGILAGYQAQGIAPAESSFATADISKAGRTGFDQARFSTQPTLGGYFDINGVLNSVDPMVASAPSAITGPNFNQAVDSITTGSLAATAQDFSVPSVAPMGSVAAPAIAGPATDTIAPAATQQAQTATRTAAQTAALNASPSMNAKPAGLLSKLGLSKESVVGGLLGNAALGPVGGLVGGLLGNYAANNPGSLGSFSNSPMTINNIGGGMANTSSVWGGDTPVGTQATASNGATITSMPGGFVAYTNKDGVTTVSSRNGDEGQAGYFGGFNFGGQSQADAAADTPGLY